MENGTESGPSELRGGSPRSSVIFTFRRFHENDISDGTAATRLRLGRLLAAQGIPVTVVFAGPCGGEGHEILRDRCESFAEPLLRFEAVSDEAPDLVTRHEHRLRALQFHFWLKRFVRKNRTVSVFVGDEGGLGYYAFVSKKLGLEFADVRFVQELHSPSRRLLDTDQLPTSGLDLLDEMNIQYLERRSLELADSIVATNSESLDWCVRRNWLLPADVRVLPPLVPESKAFDSRELPDRTFPRRLVFVAPQTARGGFHLACEALSRIENSPAAAGLEITFLGPAGRVGTFSSEEFIRFRSASWPWNVAVESNVTVDSLREQCMRPDTVVIFPAGPSVALLPFLQCLEDGATFLSSRCDSLKDMLSAPDIEAHSFELKSPRGRRLEFGNAMSSRPVLESKFLAEQLLRALVEGVPRFEPSESRVRAREAPWPELLAREAVPPVAGVSKSARQLLVTICLVTRNRPALLRQALLSIEAQSYPNFEVVVVDDGSDQKAQLTLLKELEPRFHDADWKLVRQEHGYHATARNHAATLARGEYLLFMDDDNYAVPEELSILVRAAVASNADILTCGRRFFSSETPPDLDSMHGKIWIPLGSHPSLSLFQNCVGDMNFLIKRDVFHALQGFRTDYRVAAADREILITAGLKGYRIEVVPEILYFYRDQHPSLTRGVLAHENYLRNERVARPYVEALPSALADLPLLAQNLFEKTSNLARTVARRDEQIRNLKAEIRALGKPARRSRHSPRSLARWLGRFGVSAVKRKREIGRWLRMISGDRSEKPEEDAGDE